MIYHEAARDRRGVPRSNVPDRRSSWRKLLDTLGLRSKGKQEAHHPTRGADLK